VSQPSEIRVNLPFRGRQLADFLAIKDYLGIQSNADVVRYLVHRYARELRRWEKGATQRRIRPPAVGGGGTDARATPATQKTKDARGAGKGPPDLLCLDCPLPECDEGDARCAYQQATGERERKRARTREYMRRVRAK
jgi:hypothetical protein